MRRTRGFAILSAIFLVVFLGLLGGYLVSMYRAQQATTTIALLEARAYQAAQAGLEWGADRIVRAGGAGACPAASAAPGFVLPVLPEALALFRVTLTCTQAGAVFNLIAVACNRPDAVSGRCPPAPANNSFDYVERRLTAVVQDPPPPPVAFQFTARTEVP